MKRKEAITTLESLIQSVMAAGGFKTLEALDKCREALGVVKAMDKIIEITGNDTE